MTTRLCVLLLGACAGACVLQDPPQAVRLINDHLSQPGRAPYNAKYMPDGKLFAFRENLSDPATNFIFNIELDFRMTSPTK